MSQIHRVPRDRASFMAMIVDMADGTISPGGQVPEFFAMQEIAERWIREQVSGPGEHWVIFQITPVKYLKNLKPRSV